MAKLEDLKEIAKAVKRNKVKNIHIIGNSDKPNTIFDEFYLALQDDKFESDHEFLQHFFGSKKKQKAYYKFKDRFQERLINTLFFIDINKKGFSKIQKGYYECYKNAYAIKILIGKTIRKPAISLAEKTIKKSNYYGFIDISLELGRILREHYSVIDGNKKKFRIYNEQYKKNLEIYRAEILSEEYYLFIHINHVNSTSLNPKLIPQAKRYFYKLKKINKKFNSYKLRMYSHLYYTYYFQLQSNWNNLVKYCTNAIDYFKNNPRYQNPGITGMFYLNMLTGLLILKKFQKGEEVAKKCLKLIPSGSFNWLMALDIYFRLQLHAHQYKKAKEIFLNALKQKKLNFNSKRYTETWKIYEAFLNYLTLTGKIEEGAGEKKLKPFRLSKFLNEVPTYSKDKRGSNITILILQILFLLESKKYDNIIDRTESLKTYTHRYLKDDDTFRSSCFIKMLLCLPAESFQKDKVDKKAGKYLNLLQSVPIEKAKQSAEIEVIPYETLWEFVRESLDHPTP